MLYLIFAAGSLVGVALLMLILAIAKVVKWRVALIVGLVSLLLAGGAGAAGLFITNSGSSTSSSTSSDYTTTKLSKPRVYSLIKTNRVGTGDDLTLQTDSNGKYTLKLKGLADGVVKLTDEDDESSYRLKTKRINVQKGKTSKVELTLPDGETEHEFELSDHFGHDVDFKLVLPSTTSSSSSSSDWESAN